MKISYTPHFKRSFRKFPKEIQEKFEKQAKFLLINPFHPSLRTKKYDKRRGVWQARIDRNIRFYFLIKKDICILLEIKPHPK